LQRGTLTSLEVSCEGFPDAQEASMPVLCAALRACRTLTNLRLWLNPPNGASRRAVTELLDAAASLRALSELNLGFSTLQDKAAFSHKLGGFLRDNLPSLRTVSVFNCRLGDQGVAALLDGLAANTHLRKLECGLNDLSVAFKRDRLEPALAALAARANLDA
jgi:hypothetical protein